MHFQETQRLAALNALKILDTPPHDAIDRLARFAGSLFDAPIALVSLVDDHRQWFKARVGLETCSTDRDLAFCAHAIDMGPNAVMVVEDASLDPRFATNALVTGAPSIRFYAGATLTTREGFNLGTLCVIDDKARPRPSDTQLGHLKLLARIVVDEFELMQLHRRAREKKHLLEMAEIMSGVGHWRLDLATNTPIWSDAVYRIHGVEREAFNPALDDAIAFYHPDDREMVSRHIASAIESRTGFDFRLRLVRADGALRDVISRGVCELDENDQVTAIVGLFQDVTDHLDALRAVERSEAHYRLLTENANDIVTEMDRTGRFTYVSPSVKVVMGYGVEEVIGRLATDFIHPDDRDRLQQAFSTFLAGPSGWHVEYRVLCKDGSFRWVEARPTLARNPETGATTGVTDVLRDITARKATEVALGESEERYRLLADNARDMIARFGPRGDIRFMSPGCRQVLGYAPEEMLGRRVIDMTHPDDKDHLGQYYADLIALGRDGVVAPLHFRGQHKDGHWVWLEGQPKLFFDEATGVLTSIQDVVRDISARKDLEIALGQARVEAENASAVKTEFLSNMSHELRTPLTAVLGFSRLIESQPELSPVTRRFVDRVANAGKALLATVNDILDFSKLAAGQTEVETTPSNPRAILADALDLFSIQAQEKGIDLTAIGLEGLPRMVQLAPDRVRQVLLNLVGNAVKFTDSGQVILEASYVLATSTLRVAVTDSGAGIPAERLDRLFKRFSQVDGSSTRKHGGTGLGLAICKGLVDAMGGKIGVSSQQGQGSCFWFELPAPEVRQNLAEEIRPDFKPLLEGCRVLVAEDNLANRDLVSTVLRVFGTEIAEARDGEEAVRLAADQPFDVILMDLRMPGMGGEAAARIIRAGGGPNSEIPIIAFSADVIHDFSDALFDGLVVKPIDAGLLIAEISKALAPESEAVDAA